MKPNRAKNVALAAVVAGATAVAAAAAGMVVVAVATVEVAAVTVVEVAATAAAVAVAIVETAAIVVDATKENHLERGQASWAAFFTLPLRHLPISEVALANPIRLDDHNIQSTNILRPNLSLQLSN
jgi:hypothetical protein